MRKVTIGEFLTDSQIAHAIRLYNKYKGTSELTDKIEDEVISPNMVEINRKLGQENLSRYLAYVVQYAMTTVAKQKSQ